jgi:hypothetical protein
MFMETGEVFAFANNLRFLLSALANRRSGSCYLQKLSRSLSSVPVVFCVHGGSRAVVFYNFVIRPYLRRDSNSATISSAF